MKFTTAILGAVTLLAASADAPALAQDPPEAVVEDTCFLCHNDVSLVGNMSLEAFDVSHPEQDPELAEKIIRKLRAGMMPPAGIPRPDEQSLLGVASALESRLDEIAVTHPNPGRRTFQRLNRAEYQRSVRDLLALDIDAGDYLPLDTKSANFDNIADVQLLSATLMEGYLRAASEVSRLAVGDPHASPREATYKVTRWVSQTEHVDGAPYGTRGGISVVHNFPADGQYAFRVSFHHETTGALHGSGRADLHSAEELEEIEISVNGERVALLPIDRWMHVSDPDGVNLRTEPVFIPAGPQRISAAFIRSVEGPVQDLISPHDWSIASTSIADSYGFTSLPHLRDLAITGPYHPNGVSETPSRQRIFTCRPANLDDARACAESIVSRLGTHAYRRPLTAENLDALMSLYDEAAAKDGFEEGIRTSLEGILASPHFVFRFEASPKGVTGTADAYRISDFDLASRLSFFLWGTGPDDVLLARARNGVLSEASNLEAEARRMLADARSDALATRFAAQWLRLPDLDKMHPNVRGYPDFHDQLKASMRRETELFFTNLLREDRSVLELLTPDYTFLDERLADHYGIPDVLGSDFRRVAYPDSTRGGLLGHGSVLTLTSHASRTSPVLRGKWIMEVLLGTPPPPPPPNVPKLEDSGEAEGGRLLSVREQMERHRSSPACNSCHSMIDPLGLALENFDATGAYRIKDNGVPIDASGELYDGTPLTGPSDLRRALSGHSTSFIRTFTENLMAYALGRRIEFYDMPTIRAVERDAAAHGNRMSSFIIGVVESPAFRMKAVVADDDAATTAEN